MLRRVLALAMAFCMALGSAGAAGMDVRLTIEKSDVLSGGALRALNGWLEEASLFLQSTQEGQEAALLWRNEPLVRAAHTAEGAAVGAGDLAYPVDSLHDDWQRLPAQALEAAQKLGALLSEYEKEASATAELGGAVKAKKQLSYALSAEQWAEKWPQVCEILGDRLRGCTIESKGTLRRYFDAAGNEVGAYFYAEKVRIAENDVREVRLEYGYQSGKGLYLAFRCPNARETRNVRISLTAKRTERTDRVNYAVSCDVRRWHDDRQDTAVLEISLKETEEALTGKASCSYTQKRGDNKVKYAFTASPSWTDAGGTVGFTYDLSGENYLTGTIYLSPAAEKQEEKLPVNASEKEVVQALALALLESLQDIPDEDRLQFLYYLNRPAYLTGDEKAVELQYDPQFSVTEE